MEIIITYVMTIKIWLVIFNIYVIIIIIIIIFVVFLKIPMDIIIELLTACKPLIIVTRSNCCLIRLRKFVNSMVTLLLHFSSFSARFSTTS